MRELVGRYRPHIHRDELLDDLRAVTAHDRLQGSTGLNAAADEVAARAEAAGLAVDVRRYEPGTPQATWWTFTAPADPSPVMASLTVLTDPPEQVTSYPEQPFALARGSASAPPQGVTAQLIDLAVSQPWETRVAGTFILVPTQPRFALAALLDQLASRGALGVAVASRPHNDPRVVDRLELDPRVVDRLELDPGCPLIGFSVSGNQMEVLRIAAGAERRVRVQASHTPPAPMPLVVGRRGPRTGRPRGVLIAHLCHPTPSANDNGSGVAALLGIARALQRAHPRDDGPAVEFLWAPEMVGTAAYLHDVATTTARPDFAVSLDMVATRGGHLIIEQPPLHLPAPIAAAFTAAAQAVSPPASSYSSAVTLPTWPTAVVPFVGASDHLLFADPAIAVPAAHITTGPDQWHHTSADTSERLCPDQLRRVTLMTAAAVTALCCGGAALADIAEHMHHQAAADVTRLLVSGTPAQPAVVSHREGQEALKRWHPNLPVDVENRLPRVHRLLDGIPNINSTVARTPAPAPRRCWRGPWNLYNLHRALPPSARARLGRLLTEGGPAYARVVGLTFAVDGQRDIDGILEHARAATGLRIDRIEAEDYLSLLAIAGWLASDGPPAG